MQSRLAAIFWRRFWVCSAPRSENLRRAVCSANSRTADPAIHSGEHEAGPEVHTGEPQGMENFGKRRFGTEQDQERQSRTNKEEPLESPEVPLRASHRLKSTGVSQPLDPTIQQTRRNPGQHAAALEDVSCAGLDGSPWPKDKDREQTDREEQKVDERDYYKHHKASPLSEIEIEDTRKPITRATDGTAAPAEYGVGKDVIGWMPEQLDTAEESLRRAAEIWKQNAMRGDPDAPHSRVLRALRGESF